jgi:hypothetical protein
MALVCAMHRRLVRRGFIQGRLPARHAARLHAHLNQCGTCRAHYEDVMRMERVAASSGQAATRPAHLELALWADRVVDLGLAADRAVSPERRAGWGWRVAAGAALAAFAFAILWFSLPADEQQTFAVRAADAPVLQVRALCESHNEHGEKQIRSMSGDPGPGEASGCPQTGRVFFAARAEEAGYLYAFLLLPDGQRRWLLPGAAADEPLAIRLSQRLEPVPLKVEADMLGGHPAAHVVFVLSGRADQRERIDATAPDRAGHVLRRIEFVESPDPGRR